jgi:hypothetical protein
VHDNQLPTRRRVYASVDCSSRSVGVALWDAQSWEDKNLQIPLACFVIKPKEDYEEWELKVYEITQKFVAWSHNSEYELAAIVYEAPEFFESGKGLAAARSGGLQMLMHSAGALIGIAVMLGIPCAGYNVRLWKGQMSKDLVIRRIIKKFPDIVEKLNPKADAWDAIGVGLFAQDQF